MISWFIKTRQGFIVLIMALVVVSSLWLNFSPSMVTAQAQVTQYAYLFSQPLGYRDGLNYAPRINYLNGQLIENSGYGVKNPDMQGLTCFGIDWGEIYHAGEDLYRTDGQSTWKSEVTAVGDGMVKYIAYNFPGGVLIIEHALPPNGQKKLYSLYGHLDPNSVIVSVNQAVTRGQRLGSIMQYFFDGRYTNLHDDSHLHFEMRYFYDASNIYASYPTCNGYLPGRGYSYPQIPDNFPPLLPTHYAYPVNLVKNRGGLVLPLVLR